MRRFAILLWGLAVLLTACSGFGARRQVEGGGGGGMPVEPESRQSPKPPHDPMLLASDTLVALPTGARAAYPSATLRGSGSAPPVNAVTDPTAPQPAGFAGYYAPDNWRVQLDGADVPVDVQGDDQQVDLSSIVADNTAFDVDMLIPIPGDGQVRFDWFFTTLAQGTETFGYLLNGQFFALSDGSVNEGFVVITVNGGDVFGFRIHSDLGFFDQTQVRVSGFAGPLNETPIPEPGAAMMLAVGLAGLFRRPGRRGQPRPAHPSMPLGFEACGPTGPTRGTAAIAS